MSRLKLAAAEYSTPSPHAAYSDSYFSKLSFSSASEISLPVIAEKGSIVQWTFHPSVPSTAAATVILPHDIVPHISDLQPIIQGMETAFIDGSRSVVVSSYLGGECVEAMYHFSKIRLFVSVNNNYLSVDAAKKLVDALDESSLSAELLARFMQEKIRQQIHGFSATCALWNLGSLLDEEWLYDDILNCLSEILYFRNAALCSASELPSFLFLPT
ncbi:hypothetical protein BDP27DRAFT_1239753, partial [Rhodocollybia butyracea]